jgi:mercuric ion transport protein
MGTAVASLLSAAPWLVSLSRHKIWTFSIAGALIATSFVMTYVVAPRLRGGESCAADDSTTCGEVSKVSRFILWASALIWSGGFFVAYLLGPILERMDR